MGLYPVIPLQTRRRALGGCAPVSTEATRSRWSLDMVPARSISQPVGEPSDKWATRLLSFVRLSRRDCHHEANLNGPSISTSGS